jgi:hypothetical protein
MRREEREERREEREERREKREERRTLRLVNSRHLVIISLSRYQAGAS